MSKFKIEEINILSLRGYDLKFNTECTICRCNLNSDSIYNDKLTKSLIYSGMCGHTYHSECISQWLYTNKHCPICSKQFSIINN